MSTNKQLISDSKLTNKIKKKLLGLGEVGVWEEAGRFLCTGPCIKVGLHAKSTNILTQDPGARPTFTRPLFKIKTKTASSVVQKISHPPPNHSWMHQVNIINQ